MGQHFSGFFLAEIVYRYILVVIDISKSKTSADYFVYESKQNNRPLSKCVLCGCLCCHSHYKV